MYVDSLRETELQKLRIMFTPSTHLCCCSSRPCLVALCKFNTSNLLHNWQWVTNRQELGIVLILLQV